MSAHPLQVALDAAAEQMRRANRARERGQRRAEARHLRSIIVILCNAIADAAADNVIKLPVR